MKTQILAAFLAIVPGAAAVAHPGHPGSENPLHTHEAGLFTEPFALAGIVGAGVLLYMLHRWNNSGAGEQKSRSFLNRDKD